MKLLWIFFIIAPITDLILLIKIGLVIGIFPIIGLSLFTALLGWIWPSNQSKVDSSDFIMGGILDLMILKASKCLLILPGFISSFIGILGLMPIFRRFLLFRIKKYLEVHTGSTFTKFYKKTVHPNDNHKNQTLEGEYSVIDQDDS